MQVVQLEKLYTNFVAVCDKHSLGTVDRAAILMLLHLREKPLQCIYERLELGWAPIGHVAEGADAGPKRGKDPDRLQSNVQEAIELVLRVLQSEFSTNG